MSRRQQIKDFNLDWSPIKREVPEWFRDAKFGLFFHWGPYCVPAFENEWYSRNMYSKGLSQNEYHVKNYGNLSEFGYKDFYKDFKGEGFDADSWAELIVCSGAKYAGPVAEHADNFSMWNSTANEINSVNYGPKRDVVGELEKAIRARGLNFITTFHHQWLWGWFMSSDPEADVYFPENEIFYGKSLPLEACRYIPWNLPDDDFNRKWKQKVIEVIDNYNPDMLYFDSRANIIAEKFKYELLDYYYNGATSNCNRIISYKQNDFPQHMGVYDMECGYFSEIKDFVWQVDDRLEDRRTWCYVNEPKYKSSTEIIYRLCDIVSKNGNLLLNVGPKEDGTFAEEAKQVLYEVGEWLSICGEAIYSTRPFYTFGESLKEVQSGDFNIKNIEEQTRKGVFSEDFKYSLSQGDIRFTKKGNILYTILIGCPDKREIIINSLAEGKGLGTKDIISIEIIKGEKDVEWECNYIGLKIKLKQKLPLTQANVLKITYA